MKTFFLLFVLTGCALAAPAQKRVLRESIPVDPHTAYRLEGRVGPASGQGQIGVDLLGQAGEILKTYQKPMLANAKTATYVAADVLPAGAKSARLWMSGSLEAKDVDLVPWSPQIVVNGGFEMPPDLKGRISMWSEEKQAAVMPGVRSGQATIDQQEKRSGNSSLKIAASGSWYALGSLNYVAWTWSDQWQGRVWIRCGANARAQLFLVWTDDNSANVIRIDRGPEATETAWQELLTPPVEPPPSAAHVRLILSVAGGSAWFDDAQLAVLPPRVPAVKVFVNQVGYEQAGPKSAVIATNFFPAGAAEGRLQLLDGRSRPIYEVRATSAGRIKGQNGADWGWYFWRADFSAFNRAGRYRAKASFGSRHGVSFPFHIGKDILFSQTAPFDVDFFFVQRCGFEVPGWHKACHMDDARVDGKPRDLTGGWHSAGDYNKFQWEYGDGAVTYALALASRNGLPVLKKFDRNDNGIPDVQEETEWGAKFLSKMQVEETGGLLGDVMQGATKQKYYEWGRPEDQSDGIPGTPDDPLVAKKEGNTPLAIAGWTIFSRMAGDDGAEYLTRAEKLFNFYTRKPRMQADAHLLIGAIELYKARPKQEYLDFARKAVESILAKDGPIRGGYGDSGDVPCAALATFALAFPNDPLSPRIKSRLAKQLDFLVADTQNPFGISHQKRGEHGYFFEPTSVYGQNFMFSSRAWAGALIYRITGDRRALAYAADHVDWILGKNPYNLCMMEGLGTLNPPRYHHRYDSIPGRERGAVPGAIPNGFVRDASGLDRPGFDRGRTGRAHPSYRTNEPWLVHNVLHLISVTALHDIYGRRTQ